MEATMKAVQIQEYGDAAMLRYVGAEFALADIGQAHRLSESGRARGKIALYVGQP
jgi:hypothetical protein